MADKKKSVAKAYVQVVPTVDGIKNTLTKELGGEVSSSFGDIFKGTLLSGALLGAAKEIGGAVLDIGRDAVEAAAEVKAANAQFEQTFGELESTATAALRAVSNETGIATTRLKGGYTALYAFTKSVGGDSKTALNIAQRAMTAAADSAAYYDRSVEDATETLQSFLKGNYENDAALGIAATETTRNAKANEMYAKSFKELSESQKVDVLLAMVEAGNKASGAMGQAAREADSWTNVTGELAEAWRQLLAQIGSPIMEGLTPIIQGITDALNGWMAQSSGEKLSQGLVDFRAELEAADAAARESTNSIAATTGLAQQYVARLRELEGAGLDTAESQREYKQVVELLNELMPELSLTINEVTGRLEQNTWAIEDNIQSLKKQAENQAKMAYYKKFIDSYTAAYEQQYTAQTRLVQLEEEEARIREQLYIAEQQQMAANIRGNTDEIAVYREKVNAYTDSLSAVLAEKNELIPVLEEFNTALAAEEAALDEATAGYAELAGDTLEAAAAVDELSEAYNASKDAARESIDSQIGLFDELAEESEMSAEEIVENWGKQQEAFGRYSDNLKRAVELGLDQTLVQQLSDGSQQSMLILDELLNGTELTIDEINAAFGGMSEAKDIAVESMTDVRTSVDAEYQKLKQDLQNAGEYIMEGGARGLRNNAWRIEQAMGEAADLGNKAYRMGWEINSPSRKMEKNTDFIVDGHILQLRRRTSDVQREMRALATAENATYLQEQLDYAVQYPSRIAGAAYTDSAVNHNSTVSYGGININIYTQPGQDADALAEQIMYRLQTELEQGAAAIAR